MKNINELLIVVCLFVFFFVCFRYTEKVIEMSKQKEMELLILKSEEEKELIKINYSYEKARKDDELKRNKEILELVNNLENSRIMLDYENNYQLKRIEFKGTVFETCSNTYEKSNDFIDCIRNILRTEILK